MAQLPIRHRLFRKLHKEHGIFLDTMKMQIFRRNGFGSRVISWATVGQEIEYQSFETMNACLKLPTKLVPEENYGGKLITIEIDLDKLSATNKGLRTDTATPSDNATVLHK